MSGVGDEGFYCIDGDGSMTACGSLLWGFKIRAEMVVYQVSLQSILPS
jgi:hypothetical protein